MHGDLVFPGYRYTRFASPGSAFTVIANDASRRAFQVENSRLSVNKNNPFANVAMQAAFTVVNPGFSQY